jgi:FkbM family methyltransferase
MNWLTSIIRFLYPYGAVRRVWRGPVKAMRFEVVNGMGATYALGIDVGDMRHLAARIVPGIVVYDIGANCGQMMLFFSQQTGVEGRVFCFEPVPENHERLVRNIRLNQLCNVETFQTALGSEDAPQAFIFDAARHTMGTFPDAMVKLKDHAATLTVPCTKLDTWAAGRPGPSVLKIDVEGAGLEVIEGAIEVIGQHRPGIFFEVHALNADAAELRALDMLRQRWGYKTLDLSGTLNGGYGPHWRAAVWCEPPAR